MTEQIKPLLSVADLKVHFTIHQKGLFGKKGIVRAVDGVSFDLQPGETLGVVGESGCGKSTLIRAILQLIPSSAGQVVFLGNPLMDISKSRVRALRQDMQIIFQDPLASLDPRMTVGEIIAEPLKTFHPTLSKKKRHEQVREMLTKVGLMPNMINRYPHEFSGGQCQRIGIARAMILRPKLIVCDEPVSALDVSIQAQIVNLLMDLQKEFGLSMIFISHNLSIVRHICHRIMVLYLGHMMELADRDTIYKNSRHPYTKALISAIPIPDPKLERARKHLVIKGDLPSPLNPPSGCVFRTRCPMATEKCAAEVPPPHQVGPGHLSACHYWDKV